MEGLSLDAMVQEQLAQARDAHNGRGAHTIYGGREHALRQLLLVLLAGQELSEHESPGEATLQVLHGRVLLTAGEDSWEGLAGQYVPIPPRRHSLTAVDDSAVLLTVVSPRE